MKDTQSFNTEDLASVATFFKVFGDPTRLKILYGLENGEMNVQEIANLAGVSQSAVSQHLKYLRIARLVSFRKDGKNVYYKLNDEHISRILSLGAEHYLETQA
ncbi:MAG: metalloregulator ArsR/SmtB family transcription factor [Sphaerochaetaceae bacterium]|nr:metalloregulator ArsR/SmtB family transcription factor [Sphaerochaetaceae bacterium]